MPPGSPAYLYFSTSSIEDLRSPFPMQNAHDEAAEVNTFVDDTFDVRSFQNSIIGSDKKIHSSYSKSDIHSNALDDSQPLYPYTRSPAISPADIRTQERFAAPPPIQLKEFTGNSPQGMEWDSIEGEFRPRSAFVDHNGDTYSEIRRRWRVREELNHGRNPDIYTTPTKYHYADIFTGTGGTYRRFEQGGIRYIPKHEIAFDNFGYPMANASDYSTGDRAGAKPGGGSPMVTQMMAGCLAGRYDLGECGRTRFPGSLFCSAHHEEWFQQDQNGSPNFEEDQASNAGPMQANRGGINLDAPMFSTVEDWPDHSAWGSDGASQGRGHQVSNKSNSGVAHRSSAYTENAGMAGDTKHHWTRVDHSAYVEQELRQKKEALEQVVENNQNSKLDMTGTAGCKNDRQTMSAKPNSMEIDADFLRRCLTSDNLSSNDRSKALDIVSLMESGNPAQTSSSNKDMRTTPPIASSPFHYVSTPTHNFEHIPTLANIDMKMHYLTKSITKMRAHAKFERMQQDTDRLARIEAKLSEQKDACTNSCQRHGVHGGEKLTQHPKKMMGEASLTMGMECEIQGLKDGIEDLKLRLGEYQHDLVEKELAKEWRTLSRNTRSLPTGSSLDYETINDMLRGGRVATASPCRDGNRAQVKTANGGPASLAGWSNRGSFHESDNREGMDRSS